MTAVRKGADNTSMRSSQTRRFRAEWLALGVVQLIIASVLLAALYLEHISAQAQEGDRLQAQAKGIAENLLLQLEGATRALSGVESEFLELGATADARPLNGSLKLLSDAMPGISSMLVLDAGGTIVASSLDGLIGKNFKQREYFDAPRRGGDPAKLYVSPPFTTARGNFVVVVSRTLTARDTQQFAGVATATLDPDYFNFLLRSALYAPDMRIALIHGDGKVFLDMPVNPSVLGRDLSAPTSLFSLHKKSGDVSTLITGEALATGDDRMVAIRTIDRSDLHLSTPMVVVVSRDPAAIFGPWRARAWPLGVLLAMLVLGSGLLLRLFQHRRKAVYLIEDAVAKEHQTGAERVELALRGADLGLWDLHVPTGIFVTNARERALLGYSDVELPQGASWREMIHPDDRALVQASIQPHLRGEAATYECEHRMQHRDGHYIWLSNRAMIVERDLKGAPVRIVGTHLDITERKRNEENLALAAARLQESEVELRLLTDNMPALISRYDMGQRFVFANRAYRDWLGIDPASLIGRSLLEVYGAETFNEIRPYAEAAMAGQRVVYERDLVTPNGRRHAVVTLVPQRGSDGGVHGMYGLINDITDRHDAELKLARSEERLSVALEGSGLALFDWDLRDDRLYHSAQAAAMRGDPAIETTASAAEWRSFVHPEDLDNMGARLRDALASTAEGYHVEFRIRTRSGGWLWVRARGRVVERDPAGRAIRLAGTYADINDRKIAEGRLRRLAEFDTLTGLPNRALFCDRLQQAMARAARGKLMALLFLDIDHFKTINDTLGHAAGDELLKTFAARMQGTVRESDTVARLAGDEFTIILEGVRDVDDAKMLAGKLVVALRQPIELAGRQVEVSASIGVSLNVAGESDDDALLRRADAALYEAKRRGRNGYFCDEPEEVAAE